jgi:hypothetical protein
MVSQRSQLDMGEGWGGRARGAGAGAESECESRRARSDALRSEPRALVARGLVEV